MLRRIPGLIGGLVLFGVGIAATAASGLGLGPWEAFHQGIGVSRSAPLDWLIAPRAA